MNWAQLHLALVHIPVVGALFCAATLLLARLYRSDLLFRIGCGFTVFCAVAAALSYFTGGEAFELLRAEVDNDVVEEHALVARGAFLLYTLVGLVGLVSLLQHVQGESVPEALRRALLVGNVVVLAVLIWAAHLGGLIQHAEIGFLGR